jgi:hypothetical protein
MGRMPGQVLAILEKALPLMSILRTYSAAFEVQFSRMAAIFSV